MKNLREKTLSGLFWNLTERVGLRILQFFPTIILARLLAPEQFGLVGMLSIFTALARTFLDSGFGLALIQKRETTYADECSIFYFNIFIGTGVVALFFLISPFVAAFYAQPVLSPLMRWLSLDILIESFALIQITKLTRAIDFKTLVKAKLFASLLSSIFGIAAAYMGMGVWSLVIQTVADTILQTLNLWRFSPWRPALLFSADSLKSMFGFGSRMLLTSLVSAFFDNFYQAFIGKTFSAEMLGYFSRANSLRGVVVDTTADTASRVLFPALASIQDEPERLKSSYRRSIVLMSFLHFPVMIALAVTAKPLIALLFSDKWNATAVFFQLMCLTGLTYPLHSINLNIIKVRGRSDLYLNLNIARRALAVANIFALYRWGITAILSGQIVASLFAYFINSYYSTTLVNYPVREQLLDVLPALTISALTGGGMYLAGSLIAEDAPVALLAAQGATGVILYFGLSWLTRSKALSELILIAGSFLERSKLIPAK